MSIPASAAREKLFPLIQEVNENSAPILITSKNGNAVLLSESAYESMIETLYLFSTPANAKQTLAGLEEARRGAGISFSTASEATSYFMKKAEGQVKSKVKKTSAKKRLKAKSKKV